ncbi:Norsolorinic acid ketoreductase nor1 [Cladobotryum mycophilum]|uniref:Norsolorinic acid ketoreductase nor1 n=1 Tax=Cladobotryum mycophilum TaxID=491253 RepID=A0ABR0SBV6_9HYPO
MATDKTTVLITGANRGIGRGLLETYLVRPSHTVIAAVRDPGVTGAALQSLPRAESTTFLVVKIDSTDHASPSAALSELQSKHKVRHLDLVIANAAISKVYPTAREAALEDLREHFEVNTLGPLALFQATIPLLEKTPGSKFVGISSSAASISGINHASEPESAYGLSKAGLNYLVRKMAFENEGVIIFSIHPGWVQTDMGHNAALKLGIDKPDITTEESVAGVIKVIDSATKETSGTFKVYDGDDFPW